MGLRIKSGRNTKEKQKGLWDRVRPDMESLQLLLIYLTIILLILALNN